MRTKDQIILEKIYNSFILNESMGETFLDDFSNFLERGMNASGLFTYSSEIESIKISYKDSIEFRQKKSKIQKNLSEFINNKFLKRISNLPFDLKNLEVYIQIEPDQIQNFDFGGFFDPSSSLVRIIIKINDIVKNKEDFKNEIKFILFHEMVHVRQIYESLLKNQVFDLPVLQLGMGKKTLEYWEKKFKEYLMHPAELEAYALEYNFRNKNNPNNIAMFVLNIVKRLGFDEKDKTLNNIYDDYIKVLSEYISKYKWNSD